MEIGLHCPRPPCIEQEQFQPGLVGARVHFAQFLRHRMAQKKLVGRARDGLPIGRVESAGIIIGAFETKVARLDHSFAEQFIVAADRDPRAEILARLARRRLIGDGAGA